jgi:exopolysaccharide biosynthesis predicted pyruvyltransferase EpsI
MKSYLKRLIKKNQILYKLGVEIYVFLKDLEQYCHIRRILVSRRSKHRIYFIGVPLHSNLGDQAQYLCIIDWINVYYPDYEVIEIPNKAISGTHFSALDCLKRVIKKTDIIIFQSGYSTTDLSKGDDVHQKIITAFPSQRILMMPQTVMYTTKNAENKASSIYDTASNMLFLARDKTSYEIATSIFPNVKIVLYPDIVTTWIGKYKFFNERNGVLFCLRNDNEKYYTDKELEVLIKKCEKNWRVSRTDTTKKNIKNILNERECVILAEIQEYSKYKVVVTDRYHGTIFSLISGTPVIILKTTDHKVVGGADWFKEEFCDYVHVADNLDQAFVLIKTIIERKYDYTLKPYFKEKYYDQLKMLFEETIGNN